MIMPNKNLHAIIDVHKWQSLQDSLAEVTALAIITVDYKGVPITKHSSCRKFCELVRADVELSRHCERCDSRGGLEATRLGQPYIYLCHFNIVDAAIPIMVDDKYFGAIMVGQALLPAGEGGLEPISSLSDRKKLARQTEKHEEYYRMLPRLPLRRVQAIVDLLFHLCNYIVSEAIEKNLALEMCAAPAAREDATALGDLDGYPLKSLENINRRISSAITNVYISEGANQKMLSGSVIGQALDYAHQHKNEACLLADMATLCHISPSYFSRLFKRTIGENYSSYIARLKITWAKELLESTDHPVSQICYDVGYHDACYFIKTFRKLEGITPAQYRKYYKEPQAYERTDGGDDSFVNIFLQKSSIRE